MHRVRGGCASSVSLRMRSRRIESAFTSTSNASITISVSSIPPMLHSPTPPADPADVDIRADLMARAIRDSGVPVASSRASRFRSVMLLTVACT